MNKQQLIDFEKDIEDVYKTGVIRGPIHLRNGNEDQLIKIFKDYHHDDDYVFSTWANHLHALLTGIPKEKVKARILEGQSMAMNFPHWNFYTSAIVGGILPIAVGVAHQLKGTGRRVLCFIGDMAFRTGIAHESIMYAASHDLSIIFVVEDNGRSVGTPTQDVWGSVKIDSLVSFYRSLKTGTDFDLMYYKYELCGPHSGVGEFVSF
jgi:TPP-dependent pyruvate/acetoin dehydrogenase alpha subunit